MKQKSIKYGFALALGLGILSGSAGLLSADEPKTAAKEPPAKMPDYSKYTFVREEVGEVVKADDKKVTIRKKWVAPQKGRPPVLKEMHQDMEFQFIPESLVRTSFLPARTDEKGKKIPYTDKEKEKLKMPPKVEGYAAATSDLKEGSTVKLVLIREKSIPMEKATDSDLRIKYAVIQAYPETSTPPLPANKN